MGDIFTKKGVPLLYPFSKKYYSLNIFTNSKIYNNLDIPFIVLYGVITSLIFLKIYIH
jgi:brp/blh family beta-carotene 15,15'-monooxygenase